MPDSKITATGGCLCEAVRYEIRGPLRDVVACHCTQCRRTSGHFVAATATHLKNLVIIETGALSWYQPQKLYRRGFCNNCGSSLFFKPETGNRISIAAGTLDSSVGLRIAAHIFVEESGDYYEISDDAKLVTGGKHGIQIPEN